ncbi:aspartate aminotransferase family protein [Mesorhizobium sp. BAC0120]|uniref:pyridoxal phosphate-dependent decarboxylase family protein n=1 Tax=Mesorhizobium sp. BAC0120 TaxID=3090670 RepID=UPI00298C2B5F|nr:aspartate aminotransferase family protein [Mesorhizobium sp. BAC0120]MDW6023102.1 aspartate aminotransferase family protein [Mesorhizobium sp. BAC0120]
MDWQEFRDWSHKAAEWGADYRAGLRERPVRAKTAPGDIAAAIAASPPERAEPMAEIFADFEKTIVPGMTHWQHPRFFAYFAANAAPVSVVAEYLVSAMAAQCMLWQTSPAATELETRMIDWLRQALGLPDGFSGVIQDSASSATLAAVLTMRERALAWAGNRKGLAGQKAPRVYCSDQVHTSIDRAIWVAGIGEENLVKLPGKGKLRGMDPAELEAVVIRDRAAGLLPAGVVASVGGTSVGGTDDVAAVAEIAGRQGLYLHVDAAWAGAAMICPEFRHYWAGAEQADSIVFNPHKWLGAQFDCSVHLVRNPDSLVRTLAIKPEYLKTHGRDGIINYSEWTVPLGRRFRALKLWFLLRAHGLEGLRQMIRNHVAWSGKLAERLRAHADFEIVSEPVLSLFSFRHKPPPGVDADEHNLALVGAINEDGRIYLTQTRVDGRVAIRFQAGQFETEERDVALAYEVITEIAAG